MNNPIEQAFKKLFGDMYLSESETALRIFEFGYKAGVEAEREACAKLCENIVSNYDYVQSNWFAEAIRQRGEKE